MQHTPLASPERNFVVHDTAIQSSSYTSNGSSEHGSENGFFMAGVRISGSGSANKNSLWARCKVDDERGGDRSDSPTNSAGSTNNDKAKSESSNVWLPSRVREWRAMRMVSASS